MDDKPLHFPYRPIWLRQDWKPAVGGVKQAERIRVRKRATRHAVAERMAKRRWA